MIREATIEDLPELSRVGYEFWREKGIPGDFIPRQWISTWRILLSNGPGNGQGVILGIHADGQWRGMLGGAIYHDPNDGAIVANEMFWYVLPEARGKAVRLVEAWERYARKQGAQRITMCHLCGEQAERIGRFYQRLGYEPRETHYMKMLNHQ